MHGKGTIPRIRTICMVDEKIEDIIGYISFGFNGGIGVKTGNIVTKLNLSAINDYIIHDERTNLTNLSNYVELEDLDYKTDIYTGKIIGWLYFLNPADEPVNNR